MAYNTEKLVKLAALKALAEKVNDGFATQKEVEALSGRVDDLVVAGGEPNVLNGVKVNGAALSIAEKMVDILIAVGSANGTLAVNGTDVAVKGLAALAYKTQVSEDDLDAALAAVLAAKASKTAVDTLIGSDAGKSVRTIANEELAAITPGANGHLNVNGSDVAVYTHPAHTAKESGLYKMTVDAEGHVSAADAVTKDDITGLGIPAQDTTYQQATQEADGLMAAADKIKLDGMAIADDSEVTEMLGEVFAQQA